MKKIEFSNEQRVLIEQFITSGSTINSIGEYLDIYPLHVSKFCKKNAIHYPGEKFSLEEDSVIRNNLHLEYDEIRKMYLPNRTTISIMRRTNKLGLSKIVGKVWKEKDVEILRKHYPHVSKKRIESMLPEYTRQEIFYMRYKLGLQKSEKRSLERHVENGRLAKTYLRKIEIENKIIELIKCCNGDIHEALKKFRGYDEYKNYSGQKVYDFLINNELVKESEWYLYLDFYYPVGFLMNWGQSFELYKKTMDSGTKRLFVSFDKETTKRLFEYWAKNNGLILDRESLLSITSFRKIFQMSGLDFSIRKNYTYYYEFISEILGDEDLRPYHLSIQVPNKYWNDEKNIFLMIDDGILQLIEDGIIKEAKEILFLRGKILQEYFILTPISKHVKDIFSKYLHYKNIDFDETKIKYYDGIYFDSFEEVMVYKIISSMGYSITKCKRSEKYYNKKYDERYIPDFKVIINEKEYIIEHFGLYSHNNAWKQEILKVYKEKALRKIEYFSKNFNFIYFFPEDLRNKGAGIIKKIEERR